MTPSLWLKAKEALREEAASLPRSCEIRGSGTKSAFLALSSEGEGFALKKQNEPLLFFSPEDQVAAAWASAPVADVLSEVEKKGLTLPIPRTGHPLLDGVPGTIGGWCAMNLSHALIRQSGPPREAALGMAVILGDGRVAKCGAGVVKSVAGYDIHRFLCGSRGSLAAIGLVLLRLTPLRSLPSPTAGAARDWDGGPVFIQSVLREDYPLAKSRSHSLVAWDDEGCLLWHADLPQRLPHDWLIGPEGLIEPQPMTPERFRTVKASFDPQGRWITR